MRMAHFWEELVVTNPWWQSKDRIKNDKKIEELAQSRIKWDPRIRQKFNYNQDTVYSLRGPRQVGKTTLVKLQINEFLEKNVNPWNIMYYAFDIHNQPENLVDLIKTYFDTTKTLRSNSRCYLFLDEISSVREWQKGIKKLWDDNYLKNCTIVVTGSHTIDLQRSSERLPGRRGEIEENDTYDKIFLPMKFSEYVSVMDEDLKNLINKNFNRENRSKIFQSFLRNEIDQVVHESYVNISKLNQLLESYLITGGIPKVIDEYIKNGRINQFVYNTYFQSIVGDMHSLDADEGIFRRLINHIINNFRYPFSYREIQKNIDVGSSNTVERYINLLSSMFILTILYHYDSTNKEKRPDKSKKILFHDPFFLHVLKSWLKPEDSFEVTMAYLSDEVNKGLLVEGLIGDHLIRLIFYLIQKKQMFDYSNYLFYWKDKNDYEVDYILYDGADILVPIEVKYRNGPIKRDEINGLINFKKVATVKNGIVITKNELGISDEFVKIPASIFLLGI